MMVSSGIVTEEESEGAGAVLNAAFMTYVASAVSSLLMLVYYLLRAGVFGGRSSDD
jgi:Zn-dependent membrane protease YugP